MATNYKETAVTGSQYQRANRVVVENPLNGNPSLMFVEESVVVMAGQTISTPCSNLSVSYDPNASIPLLDPATGAPTGATATHAQLEQILFSLYMQAAAARDAAAVGV